MEREAKRREAEPRTWKLARRIEAWIEPDDAPPLICFARFLMVFFGVVALVVAVIIAAVWIVYVATG